MSRIVAGIGCRPSSEPAEIVALVREAARRCGQTPDILAVPWFRDGDGLDAASRALGIEFRVVDGEALRAAQPRCATRSPLAMERHGIASVAEGCALAVSGAGATLILPRIASANATCAVAVRRDDRETMR